jgi:hypothetical protein
MDSQLTNVTEAIVLERDVSVLDAIVVEVREALPGQIEIEMQNAQLLKTKEPGTISVVLLKMIALQEVIIGIAEVVRESLSGSDIKAESQVGSRVET